MAHTKHDIYLRCYFYDFVLVKKQGAASSFRERRSAVSPLTATVMLMAAPFAHLPRTSRSSGTDGDAHHHTQTKANADLVSHRLFTEDELDYFARALKMYSDIHGLADGCTAVCASSCAEMLVAMSIGRTVWYGLCPIGHLSRSSTSSTSA